MCRFRPFETGSNRPMTEIRNPAEIGQEQSFEAPPEVEGILPEQRHPHRVSAVLGGLDRIYLPGYCGQKLDS